MSIPSLVFKRHDLSKNHTKMGYQMKDLVHIYNWEPRDTFRDHWFGQKWLIKSLTACLFWWQNYWSLSSIFRTLRPRLRLWQIVKCSDVVMVLFFVNSFSRNYVVVLTLFPHFCKLNYTKVKTQCCCGVAHILDRQHQHEPSFFIVRVRWVFPNFQAFRYYMDESGVIGCNNLFRERCSTDVVIEKTKRSL